MKRWLDYILALLLIVIVFILSMMLMGGAAFAAEVDGMPITTFRQLQQHHDLDKKYPEATALFERTLTKQINNHDAAWYVTVNGSNSIADMTRVRLRTGFDYAVDTRYGREIVELMHTKVSYPGYSTTGEMVIRYEPDNEEGYVDVMVLSLNGAIAYYIPQPDSREKREHLTTVDELLGGPSFVYTYIEIAGADRYSQYPTSQFVFHHTSVDNLYQLITLNVKFNDDVNIIRDVGDIYPRDRLTYEEYIELLDILIKKEANPSRTYASILSEGGYVPYDENTVYASHDTSTLYTSFVDRLMNEMCEMNDLYGDAHSNVGWENESIFQLRDADIRIRIPSGAEVHTYSDVDVMLDNKTGDTYSFLSALGFVGQRHDLFVDLTITMDANDFMLLGIKNLGLSPERLRGIAYEMQKLSRVSLVEDMAPLGWNGMKMHINTPGRVSALYLIPRDDGVYILTGSAKYIEEKVLLRTVSPESLDEALYNGDAWERAYANFLLSGEYLHTADYYPDEIDDNIPIACALEDMDADGIPELVIHNRSSIHAHESAYVYQYTGGTVHRIGMVPGGGLDDGPICTSTNPNYPGLLTFNGGGGYYETSYHALHPENGWYEELVFVEEWVWSGDDNETMVKTRITDDDGLYEASQEQMQLPFFAFRDLKEMFAEWASSTRRASQPYQAGQSTTPVPGYSIGITYIPENDATIYERVYDDGFRVNISEQGYRVERTRGYVDYATWGRGPGTVDKLDYALLAAVPNMNGQEAWAHLIDSFPDTCPIFQGDSFAIRNILGLDYCVFEVDERYAIVAFGGTKGDELSDIKADAQILLGIAVNQASIAKEIINALPYDEVMVTGHSLGGYVAVDTALFCSKVVECVVFDAPGRGGSVGENSYVENWNPKVVNYVEGGDKIHLMGQHPGDVIEVVVGSNALENIFGQHDIRNFIDAWTQ